MRVLSTFACALLLVACTRPAPQSRSETPRSEAQLPSTTEAPRPALVPESDASDSAASAGVLVLSPGCVRVRLADGRHLLPGFLIRPVRWDAATRTLQVGTHRFADGDRVELGGSEADPAVLAGLWVVPPAPTCRFDGVWVTGAFVPAVPSPLPPAGG